MNGYKVVRLLVSSEENKYLNLDWKNLVPYYSIEEAIIQCFKVNVMNKFLVGFNSYTLIIFL